MPRSPGARRVADHLAGFRAGLQRAVVDHRLHGDERARGLGTYAILQQIDWAQRCRVPHLYLGYWIDGHRKMDYKRRYRPLECFDGRRWLDMDTGAAPVA